MDGAEWEPSWTAGSAHSEIVLRSFGRGACGGGTPYSGNCTDVKEKSDHALQRLWSDRGAKDALFHCEVLSFRVSNDRNKRRNCVGVKRRQMTVAIGRLRLLSVPIHRPKHLMKDT